MKRERPTAVLVMAILNMVVGALLMLCICIGAAGLLIVQAAAGSNRAFQVYMDVVNKELPGYNLLVSVELGVQLVIGLMLVIMGIGLLNMQSWARIGSLVTAGVLILVRVADFVVMLAVINPVVEKATEAMYRQMGTPATASGAGVSGIVGNLVGATVFCGYALSVFIVLLRSDVAAAFSDSQPLSQDEEPEA